MLFVLVLLVMCISAINCISTDLPDYFPRCSIDDSNLNSCLFEAFNTVRPYVRKGVEEIGILPFQPLVLSTFGVSQENPMVNYTVTVWNYTIRGIDNYDVKEIKYDPNTLIFSTKIQFDPLSISSIYDMSGRLLHIPVVGNGDLQAALGPINATIEIHGKLVGINDVDYYNMTKLNVTLSVEDGSFNLNGLFNGNEMLGRVTNEMINQFSVEIVQACTPAMEQVTEEMFMRFLIPFTGSVPYYKIFPKSNNN